jgi:lipopolysaccharide heptosyltransferase II
MKSSDDWSSVRSVLCIRLDALGDVLMTTPALSALKEAVPGRRLTLLTSSAGSKIAPLLPMIDKTIAYDTPWMKATPQRPSGELDRAMIDQVRAQSFDAAVIFTVYSQNPLPAALLCHLADIPRRLAHSRENPYQLLTHWVPELEPQQLVRHEAQRQLDLVATIGAVAADTRLKIRINSAIQTEVMARLAAAGLDTTRSWIVIHPGATAASRRYPPEHFAAVARELYQQHALQLVFTGAAQERGLVDSIISAAKVPAISLAGKSTLVQLAVVLCQAALLISNNTGPVHLAAAVATPVIDLYAQTNMQHTPWQVPHELLFHDVPCKNCYKSVCPEGHHDCLRRVPPERVVSAALRLLRRKNSPSEKPHTSFVPDPGKFIACSTGGTTLVQAKFR